jgi:hypothetical protein
VICHIKLDDQRNKLQRIYGYNKIKGDNSIL